MDDKDVQLRDFLQLKATVEAYHAEVSPAERAWARIQPFLQSRGYMLRSRYRPGCRPSWTMPNFVGRNTDCEDWHISIVSAVLLYNSCLA